MMEDKSGTEHLKEQGFSASWLTLREPADHAARNRQLDDTLARWCATQKTLNIIELGAGTGSNLRYLSPLLGHDQHWQLIDNDPVLLEHLPALLQPWAESLGAKIRIDPDSLFIEQSSFSARVSTRIIDLANELDQLSVQHTHLITASALLDLTSENWLNQLADTVLDHGIACLFALNYNGNIQWQPELPADKRVAELLNQHQLGNKGFGPALGPDAGRYFARLLTDSGRKTDTAQSDWTLNETYNSLQKELVHGWAMAAKEQDESASQLIDEWFASRHAHIELGLSMLAVGHTDLLSLP